MWGMASPVPNLLELQNGVDSSYPSGGYGACLLPVPLEAFGKVSRFWTGGCPNSGQVVEKGLLSQGRLVVWNRSVCCYCLRVAFPTNVEELL